MNIKRNRWYAIDDDDGRRKVYVNNILQSFSVYDADAEDGDRESVFVQLTDKVDEYGAMPPFWSCELDEFLGKNPEETDAPSNGRAT